MKADWCWACKREHPMLDEQEFQTVWQEFRSAETKAYHPDPSDESLTPRERLLKLQREPRPPLPPEATVASVIQLRYALLREAYERVTEMEFDGDDPRAIVHYQISFYGPPCPYCGRLLRNKSARQCLVCGMDWHHAQNIRCSRAERPPPLAQLLNDRLNDLHRRRDALKTAGRTREMIVLQMAIVSETEKIGWTRQLGNAWNYLSALHYQLSNYNAAERAARMALEVHQTDSSHSAERLGCYQFMLARILAAQRKFAEAVHFAEAGLRSHSIFHDPADTFLNERKEEVARLREAMRQLKA